MATQTENLEGAQSLAISTADEYLSDVDLLTYSGLAKAAWPHFRDEFLDLARKYAGTKFESDPVYQAKKQLFEKCRAIIDAMGASRTA